MSYPQNDTTANMYQGDNTRGMIPAQPVPVVAQPPPQMMYPVAYQPQAPPYVVQTPQPNNNPQVIVIREEKPKRDHGACSSCYCKGPRQSPCGCCDPNEEYCCCVIAMAYLLMSLKYILMCLCIVTYCRNLNRYGWC